MTSSHVAPETPERSVPVGAWAGWSSRVDGLATWIAPGSLGGFVVVSQVRSGVAIDDIVRFAAYWIVALVLPGLVMARLLLGPRSTLIEDLAVGAATGLAIEVLCWVIGVSIGVGEPASFWWLAVLIAGATIPVCRQRCWVRTAEHITVRHSVALSALAGLILVRMDVFGFRSAPLPPQSSALHLDLWWHMSLVHELMRFERPQVPQVAGRSLNYHFFSHIHIATGSRLSGVVPEVLLLRLWLVPIVLVSLGLAVALGRLLTSSLTAGIATAWLAFGVAIQAYLWIDVPVFGSTSFVYTSPSQVFANTGILAATIGFVLLLRRGASATLVGWLVLVVAASSGSKSTILPILIGATLTSLAFAVVTRSKHVRLLAMAAIGLLVLEGAILALASGTSGGKVILLGTLKTLQPYRDLIPLHSRRAVNDGLLLDSIDSPKHVAIALLTIVVFAGIHLSRLAGLLILTSRRGRSDVVNWWLAGAIAAGFAAALTIDHVGLSQIYFVLSVVPLGAALTIAALWNLTDDGPLRRSVLIAGLAGGCVVTLALDYFVRARQRVGGYGTLDRILFPMLLLALLAVGAVWWHRRTRRWSGTLMALVIAAIIGALIPSEIELSARATYRWIRPVEYPDSAGEYDHLFAGELEPMIWLRNNSDASDVLLTNVHCRPYEQESFCDARGFWVVGLSGRRAVLEGWGYTNEAQRLQGVDGRVWARQPSPFVERARLNDAVFDTGDLDALRELTGRFDVRWIVAVHRAGEVPTFPESVATVRFRNDDATILEIARSSTAG